MARETTKWPSNRGPITKIMSSDGYKGDRVPLEMGPWCDFHEVGCHLGNVGQQQQQDVTNRIFAALRSAWKSFPQRVPEKEDPADARWI